MASLDLLILINSEISIDSFVVSSIMAATFDVFVESSNLSTR